jgi:thiol-disulfide isomerase/thioredoxin
MLMVDLLAWSPGLIVLIAAVTLALVFGTYRLFTDGRFGGTHKVRGAREMPDAELPESLLADTSWQDDLGERATLLQFSSAFCAPCRATRRILEEVTAVVPGVAHIEVDAEEHLDLVRRLGVTRTPTTIIIDSHGHEITRAAGAPTKQQVMAALDSALG